MLIPKYWAQYKQRFTSSATANSGSKQATIKRYGWSDVSEAEALIHAKSRVNDAHNRWLAGENIFRRERAEQYTEGNTIPIHEQIISDRIISKNEPTNSKSNTQLIVTRNSYGAHIANVNNIAIIDIDINDLLRQLFPNERSIYKLMDAWPKEYLNLTQAHIQPNDSASNNDIAHPSSSYSEQSVSMKPQVWGFVIVSIVVASAIASLKLSWLWLILAMMAMMAVLWQQAAKKERQQRQTNEQRITRYSESLLPFMTGLIQDRIQRHSNERFRLYQTPAGFRLIATHDMILPSDDVVTEWFKCFYADANYARLCQVQQCFRARLTAKPWRMNEVKENKLNKQIPANNFWFINDSLDDASLNEMDEGQYDDFERQHAELAAREQWTQDYDEFAKNYRACRYIIDFEGSDSKPVQDAINEFIVWHDKACQVDDDLPLA